MNWTGYFIAYAIVGIVMTLLFTVSLMNIAKKSDEQAEQIFDKFKRSKKAPVAIAGNWHNKSMDSLLTQEAVQKIMKGKTIIIEGDIVCEKQMKSNEYIHEKKEDRCCVCGKLTNLIEINYQAYLCGDDCVAIMDKASVSGKRYPLCR